MPHFLFNRFVRGGRGVGHVRKCDKISFRVFVQSKGIDFSQELKVIQQPQKCKIY